MVNLQEKSQIIGLHIKGKSNRKIAKELGLSRDTVNKYVAEYDELESLDSFMMKHSYRCGPTSCLIWD